MKKTLMIVAATVGIVGAGFAQSARQIDRHVAAMRRYLNLSGPQAGTIRADLFAASDEKKNIAHNVSLSPMQRRARIHEVSASTRREIAAVLTPRQLQAWRFHSSHEVW